MTNMICFSVISITLISSLIAQHRYNHYQPWSSSNRQTYMAPMHIYAGVNMAPKTHSTAPPIDTFHSWHENRNWNNLLATRTTYFLLPASMTTTQPKRYYHVRRRNRTRIIPTTTSNLQHFGMIVNIFEPEDTTSTTRITTTTMTTTTATATTTTLPSTITQNSWWKWTTLTTKSFYERFPKLPPQINRPPPPSVPRSFTSSTTSTSPSITTTTTTITRTHTTTTTTTTSTETTLQTPTIRASVPTHSEWLFNVPTFSKIVDQYPRYPTILRWFEELSRHPNISRFFAYETVGYTHENRSIVVAKIGLLPFRKNRRSVWLDGGIHAREWISTATILHIMARIINGTLARDADVRQLIDKFDFYFMPVMNPDGYVYTHDDANVYGTQEQHRMWRKNRRPHSECPGVDLNRNFPFAWDNRGASKFPCEETYRGPYPESEPEVRAVTSFILKRRNYFHAFVTLHAFGNLWMLPFSFSTRIRPHDYHRAESLLLKMNQLSMNSFKIGQSSTVLYTATGTSEDWAKAVAQIPHTFSIELPPSTDIFDTRQDELNGFTFYSDKEIGTVAESTYRLLQLYFINLPKMQYPSRITL